MEVTCAAHWENRSAHFLGKQIEKKKCYTFENPTDSSIADAIVWITVKIGKLVLYLVTRWRLLNKHVNNSFSFNKLSYKYHRLCGR